MQTSRSCNSDNSRETFAADIAAGLWEGGTVTYVALQLAFFMGFDDVILIGVDHSFQTSGPAHKLVTSDGSDPDHFHPDYFGKGVQWQLPDLEMSERGYRLAERAYAAAGRRVRNATLGGRLKAFPLADYRAVLDEPRTVRGSVLAQWCVLVESGPYQRRRLTQNTQRSQRPKGSCHRSARGHSTLHAACVAGRVVRHRSNVPATPRCGAASSVSAR